MSVQAMSLASRGGGWLLEAPEPASVFSPDRFTEEHRLIAQTADEFMDTEVLPFIDRLEQKDWAFAREMLRKCASLGLLGADTPESYGGVHLDKVSSLILSERLARSASFSTTYGAQVNLALLAILLFGNEAQKQRYVPRLVTAEIVGAYGLSESGAGSDALGAKTRASRQADGSFVITGEKMWISLADVADHFLVFAWSDLEKKKRRDPSGMSAFIVERAFKGFSSGTLKEKWGILAGNTGFFKMEDVEVPAENVVGRPGEGFKIAMFALDQGRYTVAAGATGLIRACRDASVKYARERTTFGTEIGQHQLVKEMIAQMESDYQAARLLWLRAGWLKNVGRRSTRETSLAKWFATVASERAASDAVQVHGANGYSDEYPVGRFYRNCKGAVIYEGTREIHKLMQADYVLGYREDRPSRCVLPPFGGDGVTDR